METKTVRLSDLKMEIGKLNLGETLIIGVDITDDSPEEALEKLESIAFSARHMAEQFGVKIIVVPKDNSIEIKTSLPAVKILQEEKLLDVCCSDEKENPLGGVMRGLGYYISWQNGPLGQDDKKNGQNGAFVEDIINAAKGRLEFYQESRFACDDNELAIFHLNKALEALENRTKHRKAQGIEGTYEVGEP